MPAESIVLLVAHPDDVAYLCGGTALLLKEKYDLHVLCASQGERGYPATNCVPEILPEPCPKTAAIRAQEEQNACDLLGANLTFLGQLDGEIMPGNTVCNRVAGLLSDIQPKAILTHGPFEKKDHNAVFSIAYQALQITGRFFETDLCLFSHSNETYNMHHASIFINIDPVVEQKRALIECHQTQLTGSEHTSDWVLENNSKLGHHLFCNYAEAFTTPFPMGNKRWGRHSECGRFLLDL